MNKLTYADLSDEDKLLMDGLFQHKAKKETERKIIRNILMLLRKREMDCTKDIMNLSQKAIGEKFDLGKNSAKPLTKKARQEIESRAKKTNEPKKLSPQQTQKNIMRKINEKTIRSQNGREPSEHHRSLESHTRCHG